jgi:purine nucleoside phosphorylase
MRTDAQLQNDVQEELKWEPRVTASKIGVAVSNGVVTLSGTVPTFAEKYAADKAARRVVGMAATRTVIVATATVLALATAAVAAESDKRAEKPVVTCSEIIHVYKDSQSVDHTSTQLLVDQSRVKKCVKAAGRDRPLEYNR